LSIKAFLEQKIDRFDQQKAHQSLKRQRNS